MHLLVYHRLVPTHSSTQIAWPLIKNFSCASADDCPQSSNMGWRYFIFTMGGLMLVLWGVRFFAFKLYESPKFLMGRGNDEKAVEVIHKLAQHNGKTSTLTLDRLTRFDLKDGVGTEKQTVAAKDIIRRNLTKLDSNHVKSLFASRKLAWSTSLLVLLWGRSCSVLLWCPKTDLRIALIGLAFPLYVPLRDPYSSLPKSVYSSVTTASSLTSAFSLFGLASLSD